jgi:hypothetical protein
MIEFIFHDGIEKEITAIERRFRTLREGIKVFQKLCEVQFSPTSPKQIIAPAKLHRIKQNEMWTMWKIELVVPKSGLRPNQFPRMWFAVRGEVIAFLSLGTHMDNYDDEERTQTALKRVTDIF